MRHAGHHEQLEKVGRPAAFALIDLAVPGLGFVRPHGAVGVADPGDQLAAALAEPGQVGRIHQAPVDHRLPVHVGGACDAGFGVVDVVLQEEVDRLRNRHRCRWSLPDHHRLWRADGQLDRVVGLGVVAAEPGTAKTLVELAAVHAADARVPRLAGIELHPGGGLGAGHDGAQRADLRAGEATGGLGALAGQRVQLRDDHRIGAGVGVVGDAVL